MKAGEMLDGAVVGYIRAAAKQITGGNCSFIDDDIAVLLHLARRAVAAGLLDDLPDAMQKTIIKNQQEKEQWPA